MTVSPRQVSLGDTGATSARDRTSKSLPFVSVVLASDNTASLQRDDVVSLWFYARFSQLKAWIVACPQANSHLNGKRN